MFEATRRENGNVFYEIYQSTTDASVLMLHERYTGEDAVEEHKASAHYQDIVAAKIIPSLEIREVTGLKKLY